MTESVMDIALGLDVGGAHDFEHPTMIRARRAWSEALVRGEVQDEREALDLASYFTVPYLRDRLMVDIVAADVWDGNEYTSTILGGIKSPPDNRRVDAAIMVWTTIAQHVATEDNVPMLVSAGWCLWAAGRMRESQMALGTAVDIDPMCRLALQLLQVHQQGLKPDWMTE